MIAPDVGGGFGIKAMLYPEDIVVSVAAQVVGRPVKWIEDRQEHLLASMHAREHRHRLEVAYTAAGEVTALRARVHVDCGAYSPWPWRLGDGGRDGAAASCPASTRSGTTSATALTIATNKCFTGPYRGVARPAANFSIERAMDEVAHRLGLDPLEIRRRNYVQPDEFPYTSVTGMVYDSGSFLESLEKVAVEGDYAGLRRRQAEARAAGRHLGIGFAGYTEQTAHGSVEWAKRGVQVVPGFDASLVRLDPSGFVTVQLSTHSHGQGHETTVAQVVADELALPLERIRVRFGDTSTAPYGHGTFASRSAVMGGGAALQSAREGPRAAAALRGEGAGGRPGRPRAARRLRRRQGQSLDAGLRRRSRPLGLPSARAAAGGHAGRARGDDHLRRGPRNGHVRERRAPRSRRGRRRDRRHRGARVLGDRGLRRG